MSTITPSPVPIHPNLVLTPPVMVKPSPAIMELIEESVERLCAEDKTFSVTFSPVTCPEDKNSLYALHPYYWQTDSGEWEYRQGERNPEWARPQGQKQLERLSLAIRDLALAYAYASDEALQTAARAQAARLLQVFFVDEDTKMRPEVEHSQVVPDRPDAKGNSTFVMACRFLLVVTQYLPLLEIDAKLEEQIREWFGAHVEWMRGSEQGKACMARDDNKPVWFYAVLATHEHYLDPSLGQQTAKDFLQSFIRTRQTPAKFFAKCTERTDPRHSVHFLLEPILILAALGRVDKKTLEYMTELIRYAKIVEPGSLDVLTDADERYLPVLDAFERIVHRIGGGGEGENAGEVGGLEVDGTGWEGGWSDWMRISWGLL